MSDQTKKILIVEDDEGIMELQRTRLQRCGHEVLCARSPQEALSLLDSGNRVDLYLLDYGLNTEMSGLALYVIIKERGYAGPAILVTGFEDPKIIVQAMRAGVRDFLPKSAEYLDDLPMTVERVLHQLQIEQQAGESQLIKEKQEMLESAFGAARLAAFVWDLSTGEFQATGHFEDMIGPSRLASLTSMERFFECINDSDIATFKRVIESCRESNTPIEHQFRIYRDDGELHWVFARGRFQFNRDGAPVRLICVLNDISSRKRAELELLRTHEKVKALNARLQMGIVETNHRVKNHLQKLISLIQHQVRIKKGQLTEDDVKSFVAHIQGLAVLHDVLSVEAKADGDGLSVDASDVLGRVVDVLGSTVEGRLILTDLHNCRVSPRQAASLSVILNELLSNALKHGSGEIQVKLQCGHGSAELSVTNNGSAFPDKFDVDKTGQTGLVLVRMLCRTDFGIDPIFENSGKNSARIKIRFSLDQPPVPA